MEVLVAVLAALAVLLVPIAVLMAAGAVLGASGVVELATAGKRRTPAEGATPAARSAPTLVARVAWWFVVLSGTLVAATVLLLLALNTFAFEWAVRRALAAGERKSGIAADFESADGNLFVGRVNLRNAKFVRQGHPVADFDLTVNELDIDADVWKLLGGQTVFEDVQVDGVTGQFTRNGKRDPTMPRRQFTIEELTVSNVSLDGGGPLAAAARSERAGRDRIAPDRRLSQHLGGVRHAVPFGVPGSHRWPAFHGRDPPDRRRCRARNAVDRAGFARVCAERLLCRAARVAGGRPARCERDDAVAARMTTRRNWTCTAGSSPTVSRPTCQIN